MCEIMDETGLPVAFINAGCVLRDERRVSVCERIVREALSVATQLCAQQKRTDDERHREPEPEKHFKKKTTHGKRSDECRMMNDELENRLFFHSSFITSLCLTRARIDVADAAHSLDALDFADVVAELLAQVTDVHVY